MVGWNFIAFHNHFIFEIMRNDLKASVIEFARISEEIHAILEKAINPVIQMLMELGNLGASLVFVESLPASICNEFGSALDFPVELSPHL